VFLVLALVIGAFTGLTVVAFILLTERAGMRLYPVGGAPWRRVAFPVGGSLGIGYLLYCYFPYARGSGVPQTKAALFAGGGRITMRTVVEKFLRTSATLASGIPLGREGPSVQVGAGIASVLGLSLGMRPERVKELLPVGAAAAIAAAFNTPLAAVLFSLEEIAGDLHAPVLGSVVLASATSWMVLRLLLGHNPLFKVPQYKLVHPLVSDKQGLVGVVNLSLLANEVAGASAKQKLTEVVDGSVFPHIHPDQGLDVALKRMGTNLLDILPVVSRADTQIGRHCHSARCLGHLWDQSARSGIISAGRFPSAAGNLPTWGNRNLPIIRDIRP